LLFFEKGKNPGCFDTKENKAKRQGGFKKKGVQKRSENLLGLRPTKI